MKTRSLEKARGLENVLENGWVCAGAESWYWQLRATGIMLKPRTLIESHIECDKALASC
jgi:hypothetical protein